MPWIVGMDNIIYQRVGHKWRPTSGGEQAADISTGPDGVVYMVGKGGNDAGVKKFDFFNDTFVNVTDDSGSTTVPFVAKKIVVGTNETLLAVRSNRIMYLKPSNAPWRPLVASCANDISASPDGSLFYISCNKAGSGNIWRWNGRTDSDLSWVRLDDALVKEVAAYNNTNFAVLQADNTIAIQRVSQ